MRRPLPPTAGLLLVLLGSASCGDSLLIGPDSAERQAAAASLVMTCPALTYTSGWLLAGQSAATLAKREQSGTQDTWKYYVELRPGANVGCSFDLPAGVSAGQLAGLALRVNYRGPRRAEMRWVFEAWDNVAGAWVVVADNAFAADWRWSAARIDLKAPVARFVAGGAVRMRYRTTSMRDASLLDEWVLLATRTEADGGLTPPAPSADAGLAPPAPSSDATVPPASSPDAGAPPPPAPSPDKGVTPSPDQGPPPPTGGVWKPQPGTSWQWQLTGTVDTSLNVQMYDIDLFESTAQLIAGLQAKGRRVICYFSTAYENWRPDASSFPASVLGNNLDNWPGEKRVDIRAQAVRDIMVKRLDLAVQKGCDGVEPDNVDVYQNSSGFPITAADQLAFLKFLSAEAHARGLAIGLKNDLEQVAQLVGDFDFALNEECFHYNECDALKAFITAGKAVFQVEYSGSASTICPKANALNFDTLLKNLDLDAYRVACR